METAGTVAELSNRLRYQEQLTEAALKGCLSCRRHQAYEHYSRQLVEQLYAWHDDRVAGLQQSLEETLLEGEAL